MQYSENKWKGNKSTTALYNTRYDRRTKESK